MTYSNLNKSGYLVVDVLNEDEASSLSDELINYTFNILFGRDTPRHLNLLTDQKLREKIFGYNANELIWENGNTRTPYYSKSTGMMDGHYNITKLKMIDFNPKIYKIASEIMGTKDLVFRSGIERYSIKPGNDKVENMKVSGATDMGLHIDTNLFHEELAYPFRIQSLICLSCDNDISPRDSGSLRLLTNFHHYWDFISKLLDPISGLYPIADCWSRFHTLPNNFEKEIVSVINEHIEAYTLFCYNRKKFDKLYDSDDIVISFYEDLKVDVPKKMRLLKWKIPTVKPGQMIFWHQHLPHQSVRNKSTIPRIVCYYSLRPVDEEYYGSEEHEWLLSMVKKLHFYYSTDPNKLNQIVKNRLEHDYLLENKLDKEVTKYIIHDPLAKKLLALK